MTYDLSGKQIVFNFENNTITGNVIESRVKFGASARVQHMVKAVTNSNDAMPTVHFVNATDVIEIIEK